MSLADVFRGIEQGRYPPFDFATELQPAAEGARASVLGFTGHNIVAADVDPAVVEGLPPGDLTAAFRGAFLHDLSRLVEAEQGAIDLLLTARGVNGQLPLRLNQVEHPTSHPRMQRAKHVRRELSIYTTAESTAMLAVGRGLAGRWEAGFEVATDCRNQGLGRRLAEAARYLIPETEWLYLQVAAGNVASLRAILAAGFVPIGCEILFGAAAG